MADVFISYPRHAREAVRRLAEHLRMLGVEVWFDMALAPGASFGDEINLRAHSCRAMIVCWTAEGVKSPWVLGEAEVGRQRGCLIPVALERTAFPIPFNTLHTEYLDDWDGAFDHPGLLAVLRRVGDFIGRAGLPDWSVALGARDPAVLSGVAERYPADPLAANPDQALAQARSPWRRPLGQITPPPPPRGPTDRRKPIALAAIALALAGAGIGYAVLHGKEKEPPAAESAYEGLVSDRGGELSPSDLRQFLRTAEDRDDRSLAEARLARLDQQAWSQAVTLGTKDGYADYLRRFPPDAEPPPLFAADALRRLQRLSEPDAR